MSLPRSMIPFRLLLALAGGGGAVVLLGLGLAFTPAVQSWAVGRELARIPGWSIRIDGATVRPGRIELRGLTARRAGVALRAPHAELRLPVLPIWRRSEWKIEELKAAGWTLELASSEAAGPSPAWLELIQTSAAFGPVARVFGRLPELEVGRPLPAELEIGRLHLAGEIRSGGDQGMGVKLDGRGPQAGQGARLAVALRSGTGAAAEGATGELRLEVGADRALTAVVLTLDFPPTASAPEWQAQAELRHAGARETRRWSVASGGRNLLSVEGARDPAAAGWRGTWRVALLGGEAGRLGLLPAWPVTSLSGGGEWEAAAPAAEFGIRGRFEVGSDGRVPWPGGLTGLGTVTGTGDFAATLGAERLTCHEARLALHAAEASAATLRILQPFAVAWRNRELAVVDPERDLLAFTAHAVPVRWLQPLLPAGWDLRAGTMQGEFTGGVRSGGLALRSSAPFRVSDLEFGYKGEHRGPGIGLRGFATADWSGHGWQWGVADGVVTRGDRTVGELEAKAGRLADSAQPVKFTGSFGGSLPEWMRLLAGPAGGGWSAGTIKANFGGQLTDKLEVQLQGRVQDAAAVGAPNGERLPELDVDLRIDVAADGRWAGSGPIKVACGSRGTDLAVAGTVEPAGEGRRRIDLRLAGNEWHGRDVAAWGAALGETLAGAPTGLAGWEGVIGLQAARLAGVLPVDLEAAAVVLKLSEAGFAFETGAARVGEGVATLGGQLRRSAPGKPWTADLSFRLREVDPAVWFGVGVPAGAAVAEGRFDAEAALTGRAATLAELEQAMTGEWQVTSRGGLFRGLATAVAGPTESPGRLAGILASAGNVLGGLTGRREANDIAGRPEAAAELARLLGAIRYDQLSLRVAATGARATVSEFSLISPDLRLVGGGRIVPAAAGPLAAAEVDLDLALRVRGRPGELLKYLGVPEGAADDLGYTASGLPVHLGGTAARTDAADLGRRLSALAAEKTGVAEKASELLNRIRGK